MKIIVDKLPTSHKECLFALYADRNDKDHFKPNCILRMKGAFDWYHLSHSGSGDYNSCVLACDDSVECPYLLAQAN